MIAEIFHNNISSIEEILEKFDFSLDIFSVLLEEYKNVRAKLCIDENNYLELIQFLQESYEEQIIKNL